MADTTLIFIREGCMSMRGLVYTHFIIPQWTIIQLHVFKVHLLFFKRSSVGEIKNLSFKSYKGKLEMLFFLWIFFLHIIKLSFIQLYTFRD